MYRTYEYGIMVGPHNFSLQAIIDHPELCILLVILPVTCYAKPFYSNDNVISV